MIVGVVKEIKEHEYRVGLTPGSVRQLTNRGHKVVTQTHAGYDIGFDDDAYKAAGADILQDAKAVYDAADMIVKVKEPQPDEYDLLRKGQVLFTYLHLAPDTELTEAIIRSGSIAIAYETVSDDHGGLPLLAPMSEVAGRLSIQAGARCLEKAQGGRGVLLSGVPGVEPADVTIIGGGVVGENAARMALGLGARVTILDKSLPRLRRLEENFFGKLKTVYSTDDTIHRYVSQADLVIGAVLLPGAAAPKLVNREMLSNMRRGSVVVDVAIDQGGCFETSHPTTHGNPTYIVDDVVHYCVANMPGAVARTSTMALNNATLPYVVALADEGYARVLNDNKHLRDGLNVYCGKLTNEAVAHAQNRPFILPSEVLH